MLHAMPTLTAFKLWVQLACSAPLYCMRPSSLQLVPCKLGVPRSARCCVVHLCRLMSSQQLLALPQLPPAKQHHPGMLPWQMLTLMMTCRRHWHCPCRCVRTGAGNTLGGCIIGNLYQQKCAGMMAAAQQHVKLWGLVVLLVLHWPCSNADPEVSCCVSAGRCGALQHASS